MVVFERDVVKITLRTIDPEDYMKAIKGLILFMNRVDPDTPFHEEKWIWANMLEDMIPGGEQIIVKN